MINRLSKIADDTLDRLVNRGKARANCPTEHYWKPCHTGFFPGCPPTFRARVLYVVTHSCETKKLDTVCCL